MKRRALVLVAVSLAACKSSSSASPAPPAASSAPSTETPAKKATKSVSLGDLAIRGLAAQGGAIVVAGTDRAGVTLSRIDGAPSTIAKLASPRAVVAGLGVVDDAIVLGGSFQDTLEAGKTTLHASAELEGFLAKLGKDGAPLWAKDLRGPKPKAPTDVDAIAVGKDGDVLVEGSSLAVALPTEDPEKGVGVEAIYRLDRDGRPKWKKRYDGDVKVRALALDAAGSAWAAGVFGGEISLGSAKTKSEQPRRADTIGTTFGSDFFVARVDSAGKTAFLVRFGSAVSRAGGIVLASDGDGGAVIAAEHEGSIDAGSKDGEAKPRLFFAHLDASGKTTSQRSFDVPKGTHVTGIASDGSGGAFVVGDFSNAIDLGAGSIKAAGGSDVFVAHVDRSGKTVSAWRVGGTGDDHGGSVALDAQKNVVVAGTIAGRVDLGAGEIGKPGDLSSFVALYRP